MASKRDWSSKSCKNVPPVEDELSRSDSRAGSPTLPVDIIDSRRSPNFRSAVQLHDEVPDDKITKINKLLFNNMEDEIQMTIKRHWSGNYIINTSVEEVVVEEVSRQVSVLVDGGIDPASLRRPYRSLRCKSCKLIFQQQGRLDAHERGCRRSQMVFNAQQSFESEKMPSASTSNSSLSLAETETKTVSPTKMFTPTKMLTPTKRTPNKIRTPVADTTETNVPSVQDELLGPDSRAGSPFLPVDIIESTVTPNSRLVVQLHDEVPDAEVSTKSSEEVSRQVSVLVDGGIDPACLRRPYRSLRCKTCKLIFQQQGRLDAHERGCRRSQLFKAQQSFESEKMPSASTSNSSLSLPETETKIVSPTKMGTPSKMFTPTKLWTPTKMLRPTKWTPNKISTPEAHTTGTNVPSVQDELLGSDSRAGSPFLPVDIIDSTVTPNSRSVVQLHDEVPDAEVSTKSSEEVSRQVSVLVDGGIDPASLRRPYRSLRCKSCKLIFQQQGRLDAHERGCRRSQMVFNAQQSFESEKKSFASTSNSSLSLIETPIKIGSPTKMWTPTEMWTPTKIWTPNKIRIPDTDTTGTNDEGDDYSD